ncbi:MAG: energy-coupling factor ABC transporter ATP-binding protein [Bacilli bacterium]|nr:energy-coupling factor ABC transporter ATP-binding protein [Bacilli bacterium]
MEVVLKDVSYNRCYFNASINSNEITGITGVNKESLLETISLTKSIKGNISIDGEQITNKNINKYSKKISVVKKNLKEKLFLDTIEENMLYEIKLRRLKLKDYNKKMQDSLRIVGLNKSYLSREIKTLSKSEMILINISISLLSNPDIILLDDPFVYLDKKNDKKLYRILVRLKDQFNKLIVISSNNSNILYKYTDKIILLKDNEVLIEGNTSSIYTDVKYLEENKFEIPDIVLFAYKAKKKGVKLNYHKDIRDIIKDIYKHV